MNRAAFWKVGLCWALAMGVMSLCTALATNTEQGASALAILCSILTVVVSIAAVWSGICLGIKRYHDLNKSGAWVLIQFVPLIGPFWYLIEAGFFRGTAGSNRFGADPIASVDVPATLSLGAA
jgi:uncharacterized membrane protein YhaH (DUF805 family)